jgi:quercetin dioxygenase-like cupin family protein
MLIHPSQLSGPPDGRSFVGADYGGLPISLFLVDVPAGSGPKLHRHPYSEIFVVNTGQADFQVGDSRLTAHAGDILIAPAGAAHRFTSTGDDQLRLTAIHTAPTMDTEWLAADAEQAPTHRSARPDRAVPDTAARKTPAITTKERQCSPPSDPHCQE